MSDQTWALLWSKKQNCFHIEPAERSIRINVTAFFGDQEINDYHIVRIGSREYCEEFSKDNWELLRQRESDHG